MNPILAQLYGLAEKTASDNTTEQELDLNSISAAEYLAMQQEPEEQELDLNSISAAELLSALQQAEEPEKVASDNNDLDYWRAAGRALAAGFYESFESEKTASVGDELPDEISLDDITAAEMQALLENGYELVADGQEKVARVREFLRKANPFTDFRHARDAFRQSKKAKGIAESAEKSSRITGKDTTDLQLRARDAAAARKKRGMGHLGRGAAKMSVGGAAVGVPGAAAAYKMRKKEK